MRSVILLILCLLIAAPAHAQTTRLDKKEIEVRAQLLDARISLVLGKARLALFGLSDLLSSTELEGDALHQVLKDKVAETGHIRAVLFLNEQGIIAADSSRQEVVPLDLSDRSYFLKAKETNDRTMHIGSILKGRSSGFPFIPLTVPVRSGDKFLGVLAAVLTPEELLVHDQKTRCELCVSMIIKDDGTILEQFPDVTGMQGLVNSFSGQKRADGGYAIVDTGGLEAKTAWITNDFFPIKSIYLEFIQQ